VESIEKYGGARLDRRDVDLRKMRLHKREEKGVIELKECVLN